MIDGLEYYSNMVSIETQLLMLEEIDNMIWSVVLKRRIQQYGFRYDAKRRTITDASTFPYYINDFSKWLGTTFNTSVNQCIINEYLKGQSISAHVDHTAYFDGTIFIVSLLEQCVMRFRKVGEDKKCKNNTVDVVLEPGSIVILKGEARYKWTHELKFRGEHRRVSITYRNCVSQLYV